MFDKVANKECLLECASELRRKHYRPGFDGMTVHNAILWLEINADQLCRRLARGSYEPMPATTFRTAKHDGTCRQLGKLSVLDMVIQKAIIQAVTPGFEASFSQYSYAYRPGRGAVDAVQQYCTYGTQYSFAAKIDPKACFDNIDHNVLQNLLDEALRDSRLVALIMQYVRMPVVIDGEIHRMNKGLLQGAPLSNLLCNVYLSSLDRFMEERAVPFVRYADDIVIFAHSHSELTKHYDDMIEYLKNTLLLQPNANKCKIGASAKLKYLGYGFENSRYGLAALPTGTMERCAYRKWHTEKTMQNRRRIDILQEGILRQKDYSAAFDDGDTQTVFPVLSTDVINIYSSVVLDTNFLRRTMEHGITVNIFDEKDDLIGRFIPNATLHTPVVPHQQLMQYYDEKARLDLAKRFVLASIHNCRLNIRYYKKQKPQPLYDETLEKIDTLETNIKNCKAYESLLMLEARVRESYYSCYDSFLNGSNFTFEKRTRRPPHNEVNAMLSFGNTILYSLIATEINKSPLDIRIGYLHATNRRAESLNLDMAEAYKPLLVDRTVFSAVNLGIVNKGDFTRSDSNDGVFLNDNGKRKFLRQFYDKLDTTLKVGEEKLSYYEIIQRDVQSLTRYFRRNEKYVPFKQVK